MQFSPRPGDAVTARGARWIVVDVRAYEECRLVTLAGASPPCAGIERRLLHPFDTIGAIDRPARPRVVSGARWRAACGAAIAAETPPGSLRQARAAAIDLMPHQLEPALAVLAGSGTRVLLADEVGLGKTIQAGLIVAELLGRAWIERVLVLAPAGLRDQWIHELSTRFGIEAASGDASSLRRLTVTLPLGMNPWSALPIVVASTDYVKRAEVLPAVARCRWDAVVVDEAHGAAGDSDRRAAVDALASRASYVVLLTATPHSGDRSAFASLCGLGSAGEDALLVFRRTRATVRGGHLRRVRTLRVRLSAAERAMHDALLRYADAVGAERGSGAVLALSVLHKRAFSSPWSLAQSVARRLATLEREESAPDARQLALPLADLEGEQTMADLPPEWPSDLTLADPIRDRMLLTALLDTCRTAAGGERKLSALRRLLRRAGENAIVFTEYRDTLRHVERFLAGVIPTVTLHGGLGRDERASALSTFERQHPIVLLATDAAGEGLNLQRGCRLVVNLELPWNPTRLEQRIGRVDRIGQTRTVHAVHLVADRTGEVHILDRLHARVAVARTDIETADPVGVAESDLTPQDQPEEAAAVSFEPRTRLVMPDARAVATVEVARLEQARAAMSTPLQFTSHGPLVVSAAHVKLQRALGTKALLLWTLAWEDRTGRAIESHLATVTVEGVRRSSSTAAMRRTVQELAERLAPTIAALNSEWRDKSASAIRALVDARLARERAVLAQASGAPFEQFQPGLFDRRAERLRHFIRREAAELHDQLSDRLAFVERMADSSCAPPALLLAVLP